MTTSPAEDLRAALRKAQGQQVRHRTTDPACVHHRPPGGGWWRAWARWRYDRARGRRCRACDDARRSSPMTTVVYGYIKPRRCRSRTPRYTRILRRAGIKRLWLRYAIIRWTCTSGPLSLATVGDSRMQSTVAGYAWTRRQAERAVDALRRAAP